MTQLGAVLGHHKIARGGGLLISVCDVKEMKMQWLLYQKFYYYQ